MENIYLKRISTVATVIFGNVLYALVVKLFLLPGNLMTGGTTGIGLVVNHFTGIVHFRICTGVQYYNAISRSSISW